MATTHRRQNETTAPRHRIAALQSPAVKAVVQGHAIERGHPLPPARGHRTVVLAAMAPGDSTVIAAAEAVNWHNAAKKMGAAITCRKLTDTTCRMWRLE
jgi:hypothetical protein